MKHKCECIYLILKISINIKNIDTNNKDKGPFINIENANLNIRGFIVIIKIDCLSGYQTKYQSNSLYEKSHSYELDFDWLICNIA